MSYFTAIAAVAAVVSAGVSIYSANEQSSAQAAMAEYNRMAAEQNASWQRLAGERAAQAEQFNAQIAGFNADAQGQQAQMNRQMLGQQSDQLRAQATAQDAQARDQAGRIRAEKDRILGLQRSQFAAGGVTPEGSPLAVLADTANMYDMQVNDTKLLANLETNKKRREAGLNDIIGDFNFNQDTFASMMNSKAAKLSLDDAKFAEEAAGAGYRINLRQAAIEERAGMSQSRGTMYAGYGSALSNISQAGYYGSQAAGGWGSGGGNGKAKDTSTGKAFK